MAKVDLESKVETLEKAVGALEESVRKLYRELNSALEVANMANNSVFNLREQVKVLTEKANRGTEALTKRYK